MRFWMRIRGHGRLTFNSLFYLDFVGGGVGVWLDQRNWSASLCGHSGLEGVGWARRVLLCVLIRWTWENRFICTGFTATVCLSPRLQPPSEVCRTFILFLFFILSQEKGAYCFLVNTPPTPPPPHGSLRLRAESTGVHGEPEDWQPDILTPDQTQPVHTPLREIRFRSTPKSERRKFQKPGIYDSMRRAGRRTK